MMLFKIMMQNYFLTIYNLALGANDFLV